MQKETKGTKEKRGMKDIKSQTCGVKGTEKEQEMDGESEELRKTRHKIKDAECKKDYTWWSCVCQTSSKTLVIHSEGGKPESSAKQI